MTTPAPRGLRTFGLLWTVQVASLLGSEVTRFGLGLWLLARSGAVADFASVLLCETVPYVLLSPLGGALTDRYDRRLVLALSDLASTLALVPIAVAASLGVAEPWLVYAGVAFSAATSAAQSPAFVASVAQVVPPSQIARATGLTTVGRALAHVAAPAIAAPLATLGPGAVISVEVATTVLALATLPFLRLPRGAPEGKAPGLWAGIAEGFAFLRARLDLRALVTALAILNLAIAFAEALLPPMLLRRAASQVALGVAASVVAAGGVCGAG
ncbi:MAG: MFS transporter, partial [Myxococcaceae bacterium]|nr:MFS transporter [Myxococcaceae bacterium]